MEKSAPDRDRDHRAPGWSPDNGRADDRAAGAVEALTGALHGLRAIALGRFPDYEGYSDRGWTLLDVLADRLAGLGIPVLGGLELGHGTDPLATLLGTRAHLDADSGTLTVEPAAIF